MIAVIGRGATVERLKELGHAAGLESIMAAVAARLPLLVVLESVDGSPEELDALGKQVAEIASAASAPTRVIVDRSQDVLWQSLRNWIYPPSLLVEVDRIEVDTVVAAGSAILN